VSFYALTVTVEKSFGTLKSSKRLTVIGAALAVITVLNLPISFGGVIPCGYALWIHQGATLGYETRSTS